MTEFLNNLLSSSARRMKRSAIREILKHLEKPEMISFAGGLPAPETFPVEDLREIVTEVLEKEGSESLQYSTTEGDPLLRRMIVERHKNQGLSLGVDNVIITTGSQQALDLLGRIFIDPGDCVLCGLPSYLGGISAFMTYGAEMHGISLDENGMIPDLIDRDIRSIKGAGKKIKFIYIIPDFQNPAGITMPEERRKKIIEIANKHKLLIVEDSPYRDIRFEGESQKMLYELDTTGSVITLCTFSKIFAPGFRVGWMLGDPLILDRIVMAKQTADLCTSAFVQKVIAHYMQKGLLEKNVGKTIELYRERRNHMLDCFRKYMPDGVRWTEPQGGLFLFVTLPEDLDTDIIFKEAIEQNVAFVCGSTFYCNNAGKNTMRLNFSFSDRNEIEEGVKRLSRVIRDHIGKI